MKRRTFVISVGSITAASGAALGSGAFDLVEADRSANISVSNDSESLIGLSTDGSSEFVSTDGANLLQLEYTGSGGATGANDNAVTTIEAGFTITNNATQGVGVKIGHDAAADGALEFYGDTDKNTLIEEYPTDDSAAPNNLDPYSDTDGADSVDVTFEIDTTADITGLATITISADPSTYTSSA